MQKRLFICADRSFPRGDAGANRILFMAKALREQGWEVVVISIGKNNTSDYDDKLGCYVYEGVHYLNIKTSTNKRIRTVEHNLIDGKRAVAILKNMNVCSKDRILLYSSAYPFSKAITTFARKNNIKAACDIVEWHQPFQFKKGENDLAYKLYKKFFYEVAPGVKNIIAISQCLNNHFKECGCNVITIPIYIDSDNRKIPDKKIDTDKLNLIYPGYPYRKDDFESMAVAIDGLDENDKKRVVLHSTGVNTELLRNCINDDKEVVDRLVQSGNLVVHSWMEYNELIELYSKIDFGLIARPINIVTQANFPSKLPELFNKAIPVITNKVGDVADYLEDGVDAVLYEGEGPQACQDAIKRALAMNKEERKKMSESAFESAFTKFNYHQCGEQLDRFFNELL